MGRSDLVEFSDWFKREKALLHNRKLERETAGAESQPGFITLQAIRLRDLYLYSNYLYKVFLSVPCGTRSRRLLQVSVAAESVEDAASNVQELGCCFAESHHLTCNKGYPFDRPRKDGLQNEQGVGKTSLSRKLSLLRMIEFGIVSGFVVSWAR